MSSKNVRECCDETDRRLLRALQRDARRPIADLAAEVGLSASSCHRRVRLLEEAGVIAGYVGVIDGAALGLRLSFFVEATLASQQEKALAAFEAAVAQVEEIVECHLMAGGTDYLLRVVAEDVADFERIHRDRLARLPHIARLRSNLALRTVRAFRGYPVR